MKNLIAAVSFFAMTACGNMTAKNIGEGTLACTESQASSLTTALLPSVSQLLSGQSPNWDSDLESIVSALGDAAVCAIDDATGDLGGSASMGEMIDPVVRANAAAFAKKYGITLR